MAIKLTPQQTESLILALDEAYDKNSKNVSFNRQDFEDTYSLEMIRNKIANLPLPALTTPFLEGPEAGEQKDLFKEKGIETETLGGIWNNLEHVLGDEKTFQNFISGYISREIGPKIPKAFLSIPSPTTKNIEVRVYDWNLKKYPGFIFKSKSDSTDLLQALSVKDQKALLGKLKFDAKLEQYKDTSGWELVAPVSVKKVYLNFTFDSIEFAKAALNRLTRDKNIAQLENEEDKDAFLENLKEFFEEIGAESTSRYDTEEAILEADEGYAADDAANSSLEDILDRTQFDEEIETYIERLKSMDVSKDDIKEALMDSAESEASTRSHRIDNAIGSYQLSSEDELYSDYFKDEFERKAAANVGKFPYPDDLDSNLSLLNQSEIDELEKTLNDISMDFKYDPAIDGFTVNRGTVYLGERNFVVFVVDSQQFISKAKRLIKDKKLAKRGTLKKSETSMKNYPALSQVLADYTSPKDAEHPDGPFKDVLKPEKNMCVDCDTPIPAGQKRCKACGKHKYGLEKAKSGLEVNSDAQEIKIRVENLPPASKRDMISELYTAIAHSLQVPEERIGAMKNFLYNQMSDSEVNSEWKSIQNGNAAKLVKMFRQLQVPGMAEKHADKMMDLEKLHQQIAEGIHRTKEAGGEVDPKTFEAVEKIVVDFADEFMAEMSGQKALPGKKKQKLLNSYPTLARVLAEAIQADVECKHCGESIGIRDDETTTGDPYVGNCPHCGKSSESTLTDDDKYPAISRVLARSEIKVGDYVRFIADPKLQGVESPSSPSGARMQYKVVDVADDKVQIVAQGKDNYPWISHKFVALASASAGVEDQISVTHDPAAIKESMRLGMFEGRGFYLNAIKKMEKALEEHQPISFFVKDSTGFGGLLWLKVGTETLQLSKNKLRMSDVKGLLNGYH